MNKMEERRRGSKSWFCSEGGAAAMEFVIWLTVLVPGMVNAADLGLYALSRTQVTNAAQAGAQAAWTVAKSNGCSFSSSKGSQVADCTSPTSLPTAVTRAITNSSVLGKLGTVAEYSTDETEGYYCADVTTGKLTSNGTSTTCASGATAGYYYKVGVRYTYQPVFQGATVTSLLNTTMTQGAWIRLQ